MIVDRQPHLAVPGVQAHLPWTSPTFGMIAVAHHQPAPGGVDLIGELLDIGRDLGLQRSLQHLAGTVADNLTPQRPTVATGASVGKISIVNYGKRAYCPEPARQCRSVVRANWTSDHPQVPIIARGDCLNYLNLVIFPGSHPRTPRA